MWLVSFVLLFPFHWRLLLGKLHVSQKYIQKIPSTKMRITCINNDSSGHRFLQSIWNYLSLKSCIISKPFNWFAKQINWLVPIWSAFSERYFRTDYNIVCVQGEVHRPIGPQVIIMERKWFFFTWRKAHVLLNG